MVLRPYYILHSSLHRLIASSPHRLIVSSSLEDLPVHHGQHRHHQRQREDGAEADDHAHGHPEGGVRHDHRHHAQGRGRGGEEDGAHTAAARFEGGLSGTVLVPLPQTLRVLEHDDGVAHDDADQADHTQHRRDAEVETEKPET